MAAKLPPVPPAPPAAEGEEDIEPRYRFSQFDGMDTEQLVRALDQWQQDKETLEAEIKKINRVYDFLRITRIPAHFDDHGIDNIKIAGVGRCSLTADMHVSIAAERKPDALQWLEDTNRGALIERTVNSSTLKAVVKKAMLAAEQLPEGVFNVSPFTRATLTRKGI